jgi:putative DNA primase/helicase
VAAKIIDFSAADIFSNKNESKRSPPRDGYNDRPIIRIEPGDLPSALKDIEEIISRNKVDIYRYGVNLVHVVPESIRIAGGGNERSLHHKPVKPALMLKIFAEQARFEKYSKTAQDYIPCDPPDKLAEMFIAKNDWNVPTLLGVTTCPTLRFDGSILETPGYDQKSGLIYDPLGVNFPSIPKNPTKEEAKAALAFIAKPLRFYKFCTNEDRSVALSGILTSVIRRAMPNAPMHAFDAPVAGSGKSNLVDYASVIATGHQAAVTTAGEDKYSGAEFAKRIASSALAGESIISLDNLEESLSSNLLAQMLTQPMVKVRIFGFLDNVPVPSTAMFFANGNNLLVEGDLNRRVLVSRIDAGTERPELSRFPFNPVKLARRARTKLLVAALIVLRAYVVTNKKINVAPFGSYYEWSRLVREPLIWLGEADPTAVTERSRASDPLLSKLKAVVTAWARLFGFDREVLTREIVTKAMMRDYGYDSEITNQDLYEALHSVSSSQREAISPDRLGWYLRKNLGKTVDIFYEDRIVSVTIKSTPTTTQARWFLSCTTDQINPKSEELF